MLQRRAMSSGRGAVFSYLINHPFTMVLRSTLMTESRLYTDETKQRYEVSTKIPFGLYDMFATSKEANPPL